MRKTVLVVAVSLMAVAALGVVAHAALATTGHAGHAGCLLRLERLSKALGVTPEQKAQIRPIITGAMAQAKAIRADKTLSEQDRTSKLREVRRNAREQVLAVLTPDQRAKLGSMVANRFGKALNLTADQKDKIHAIRTDARTKAQAIRADQTLTDAQRQAALKDLRQSTMAQIKALLTPDQQSKLAQLKGKWHAKRVCGKPTG